ncbi:hypothetical protein [Nonomuraea jabiensis]|uniref:Uncharacterized protein n=1 Tax=Nonomuraea jabiensis TaxID=882448 RepID=A0A7W9GGY0_9ACTN|nr:hypothetical protein [Nonomuraea jabiensis]MBB5783600.1 hypothetical protein [Nonomuraea jabiensis]
MAVSRCVRPALAQVTLVIELGGGRSGSAWNGQVTMRTGEHMLTAVWKAVSVAISRFVFPIWS